MHVFYTPRYYAEIGAGHVFPIRKFELVRDKLLAEGTLQPDEIIEPEPASVEDVLLVHTEDFGGLQFTSVKLDLPGARKRVKSG